MSQVLLSVKLYFNVTHGLMIYVSVTYLFLMRLQGAAMTSDFFVYRHADISDNFMN